MSCVRRLLVVLALAGAAAGPAFAADPEPVATAQPGRGAPMSTAEQIDQFLKTSPAAELPQDTLGVTPGSEPRKIRGEAGVSAGSGGYRSGYVRSDIPVGQTGTVGIAVGETKFGNRYGYRDLPRRFGPGGYQSLGLGPATAGAPPDPSGLRCRRPGEAGPDLAHDPRMDGLGLSPCSAFTGTNGPP